MANISTNFKKFIFNQFRTFHPSSICTFHQSWKTCTWFDPSLHESVTLYLLTQNHLQWRKLKWYLGWITLHREIFCGCHKTNMIQLDYLAGPLVYLAFHLASHSNVELNCRIKYSKYICGCINIGLTQYSSSLTISY